MFHSEIKNLHFCPKANSSRKFDRQFVIIDMEPRNFDPKHTGELLKHMDKQNEVLMDAYRSMFHELRKLQVEEETLMRQLYEVMVAHGLTKKDDGDPNAYNSGAEHSYKEVDEANAYNSEAEHSDKEVNEANAYNSGAENSDKEVDKVNAYNSGVDETNDEQK